MTPCARSHARDTGLSVAPPSVSSLGWPGSGRGRTTRPGGSVCAGSVRCRRPWTGAKCVRARIPSTRPRDWPDHACRRHACRLPPPPAAPRRAPPPASDLAGARPLSRCCCFGGDAWPRCRPAGCTQHARIGNVVSRCRTAAGRPRATATTGGWNNCSPGRGRKVGTLFDYNVYIICVMRDR